MSLIGQILQDRYRISYEIGEGGMGRVYYAEDMRLNQVVAIKETLAPKNEPPKHLAARVKAFQREAQLLAGKIKHHAIPRVIDYFQSGDNWYIVMDYVDGDSLEKQLQKRGEPFSLDEVLFWVDQLLEILGPLHSGDPQVIHRDIKPSNIKVKNDRVYLLDFGLAKQLTGSKTSIARGRHERRAGLHAVFQSRLRNIRTGFRRGKFRLRGMTWKKTRTAPARRPKGKRHGPPRPKLSSTRSRPVSMWGRTPSPRGGKSAGGKRPRLRSPSSPSSA